MTDVVEVNTEHHYINLEIGILLGWRDERLKCRNQVKTFFFLKIVFAQKKVAGDKMLSSA